MPSVLLLCPHCEKHAEVQVTSVTRSRPCPHCGESVLLQTGGKEKTRRVLLTGTPVIAEAVIDKPLAPAYEPRVIKGDVFERLKSDPEVREFRNKLIMGVTLIAGVIALAVVGDTWLKSFPETQATVTRASGQTSTSELTVGTSRSPMHSITRSEAAHAIARKFLGASSVSEYMGVVLDANQWETAIKRYLLMKPLKPTLVTSMSVHDIGKYTRDAVVVRALLPSGSQLELHVVWQKEEALIDWPSFVGWSEMEWSSVLTQAPNMPVQMRVIAELAENYTNDFSDSTSLLCVKLSDPLLSTSQPLYAYAQRDSVEAQGLGFLLRQSGETTTKLILSIRFPANPMSRDQVWIDKVVAPGWFYQAASTARTRN